MKGVETIARIRREFFVQGRSIKEIGRELKVSRNTVRKVLRSGATAFDYEREVQPLPKLGPWQDELDRLLASNAGKAARERLTLIRIFEELRGLGYEGGYDAVRRYARRWSKERGAATAAAYRAAELRAGRGLPVRLEPRGRAAQRRDGDGEGGARPALPQPDAVRAGLSARDQEMVFDAHDRAFAFFKGACTRGIYDNMKTAVETIFVGKERAYNRRFLQMCSHYLVEPVACTPASGWEKGQVENQVGLVRERFFTPRLRVKSYDELNAWLLDQLHRLRQGAPPSGADASRRSGRCSRRSGRASFPMPAAFDGFHAVPASVSKTCLVRFDNNKYSVAASAVGRPVEVHAYADRIVIRQDGRIVGEHPRSLRPRRDGLRSLALRAGAGPQARRAAQRRAVQGLGAAGRAGAGAAQARRRRRRRSADGRRSSPRC